LPCCHCTKVSSTYLNYVFGFLLLFLMLFLQTISWKCWQTLELILIPLPSRQFVRKRCFCKYISQIMYIVLVNCINFRPTSCFFGWFLMYSWQVPWWIAIHQSWPTSLLFPIWCFSYLSTMDRYTRQTWHWRTIVVNECHKMYGELDASNQITTCTVNKRTSEKTKSRHTERPLENIDLDSLELHEKKNVRVGAD